MYTRYEGLRMLSQSHHSACKSRWTDSASAEAESEMKRGQYRLFVTMQVSSYLGTPLPSANA